MKQSCGFTLIEALAALLLTATVAALLTGTLHQIHRMQAPSTGITDHSSVAADFQRLGRYLTAAFLSDTDDRRFFRLKQEPDTILEVLCYITPGDTQTGDTALLSVSVKPAGGIRMAVIGNAGETGLPPRVLDLFDGAREVVIQVRDPEGSWQNEWDESVSHEVPCALRLTVTFPDKTGLARFVRTFPFPEGVSG